MAELPRYQQQHTQVGQSGKAIGLKAEANTVDSFISNIQGLKQGVVGQVADNSAQRAKEDAEQAFAQKGLQAKVNRDLTVYGKQYTASLNSMHAKQLAIDTNNQMDSIFQDNQDNPARFEKIADAHYKATNKMLPAHLQADYAINFEANKARYSGTVRSNRIRLDKEKDAALTTNLYDQSKENATQMMRDGNNAGAMYELNKGVQTLDDALANQTITATQHEAGVDEIKYAVSKANFKMVNDGNIERNDLGTAQDYIDNFRSTTIEGFTDERREALADEMQRDLDKEIRLQESANNQRSKYENDEAKALTKIYENGETVEIDQFNKVATGNLSPGVAKDLNKAKKHSVQVAKFSDMDLNTQADYLTTLNAEIDAGAKSMPIEERANKIELRTMLEKKYKADSLAIKNTPLSYSEGKAFKTELEDINLQDPEFMSKSADRVEQVNLASAYVNKSVGFFQKKEVQDINSRLPLMSSEEKMDFIGQVNQLPEDMRVSTFGQFKNELGFAGELYLGGNPNAARISLQGKGADVTLEPNFKKDVQAKLSNVYAGHYDKDQFNMALEGISNYAKGMMLQGEEVSYSDAVELSVGVVSRKWNNKAVLLPQGVQQSEFEEVLDNVVIEGRPALTKGLNNMTDYFRSGDYQLISVSPGKYKVKAINGGNAYIVADGEEDFILDYNEYSQ